MAGCAFLALSGVSESARPCGAFVALREKAVPSLSVEQTLIVYDAAQELEHFVRQIAIRDPSPGFGFVVPVPEKPTVSKVKDSPFERLAKAYPLSPPGRGLRAGASGGGMPTRSGAAVQVLSQERVGSFTAFVLSASDPHALQQWFTDNRLVVPSEAQSWLDHYVKHGFFFVALRYEKDQKDSGHSATRAEAIRISFKTPLPFYPYREPQHERTPDVPRDLAVWLVSDEQGYTPVSLFESGSQKRWQRPLLEHATTQEARAALAEVLGSELKALLPASAQLQVQVFEDQKRGRAGFGDVVMVPKRAKTLSPAQLERSRKLMAALDPAVSP